MTSSDAFRRKVLPWATGVVLALCSCATDETRGVRERPVAVPAAWQSVATVSGPLDTVTLAAWWTRFNDPVLDAVIASALGSSPDLRSALSRMTEYRARRGLEHSALFPALNAGVSGGGTRRRNRDTAVTSTSESYAAALDASWQVDLFGRQRLAVTAASADLAQAQENYHGAQVSLAADVASAYLTLRSAEAQRAVVERSFATRLETVQLTQWREQAGTGNARDTQQALATLELARASIPVLELTRVEARHQLALLCGQVPGALDALLMEPRAVPAAPAESAIGIPAEMLRQRPDVRAAERGIEAAFARTEAARGQRLPSLALSGSIGVEAFRAGRLFDPAATVISVLGSLTAPLFDAGRIRQTITIQREQEQQAAAAYEGVVLAALGEVENALAGVQRQSERLDILARATAAARESAALAALQYEAGQVDLLISLDAQRTLLDLEQQAVTTAAGRAGAHVQLYKALGGGWTSP